MKINSLKINAYGNLENKDIELKKGINIIHGSNESGKSTLLNYIVSSFYGISKNKDGKELSDYERYKPWEGDEFSGRISYELDNNEIFEVFRDFNKKNPKIYNARLEEITNNFEIDKKDGSKFFIEQTGVDKQMYLATVVSTQEELRLDEKDQNMLIQKIANLAGTGEDNVSYKKALTKLQEKIRNEIGTNKTSQKPINITEKEIFEIKERLQEIEKYKNRKYEIENEKYKEQEKLQKLDQEKQILLELQNSMKDKENFTRKIEIKENDYNDNLNKISDLQDKEKEIEEKNSKIQDSIKQIKKEIQESEEQKEKLKNKLEYGNANEEAPKEKNTAFIIIMCLLLVAIVVSIVIRNYILAGVIGIGLIIEGIIYANKNKKNRKLAEKMKNEKSQKTEELEEQKEKLETKIKKSTSQLESLLETEKQISNELSMIKGQIILLKTNNKKMREEIENNNEQIKDIATSNIKKAINKYKDQIENIENILEHSDIQENIANVEDEINNCKIKIKGLEIEYNTIMPQLDEMVELEEKLEADQEKLSELKSKEKVINIAIDNLMNAYEEMKTTITPKFTRSLSSSIEKITNRKYEKVTINDENGLIVENGRGEYVEANKLSTGTIDQLYFALRLSMIDELSKENLPIVLDEAFAYFDNDRLKTSLGFLINELKDYQAIIFTCTDREIKVLNEMGEKYNLVEL